MQKNRNSNGFKRTSLRYGNYGLVFNHEGRFEIKYIFMIRKIIRKMKPKKARKKRKVFFKPKMIWFFLFPNFIISQKSKNSRMGKGKGDIIRWTIRVKSGLVFFEFNGFSNLKLMALKARIQKLIHIKISLITKILGFYSTVDTYHSQQQIVKDKYSL